MLHIWSIKCASISPSRYLRRYLAKDNSVKAEHAGYTRSALPTQDGAKSSRVTVRSSRLGARYSVKLPRRGRGRRFNVAITAPTLCLRHHQCIATQKGSEPEPRIEDSTLILMLAVLPCFVDTHSLVTPYCTAAFGAMRYHNSPKGCYPAKRVGGGRYIRLNWQIRQSPSTCFESLLHPASKPGTRI